MEGGMRAHRLAGSTVLAFCSVPVFAQSKADSVAPTGTPQSNTPMEPMGPSEAAPTDRDLVVTGIGSSLRSSVAAKRNAADIDDPISAEDTGNFVDNNVAESLQRITGVAIDRSGGERP